MKQLWYRISYIGVDKETDQSEIRYIILVNTLAFVIFFLEISYIPLFLTYRFETSGLSYFIALIGTANLGVIILNYYKLYQPSRMFFGFLALVMLIVISVAFGRETLVHFFLLESIVIAFFIYPTKEKSYMFLMVFLFVSAFVGLEIWFINHSALLQVPSSFLTAINYAVLTGLLILILAISFYSNAIINRFQAELEEERQRSERLLLNILPKPIAEKLKVDPRHIADEFEEVSILFADICNFTRMTESMTADKLVAMLNAIFSEFDKIADTYGLEKIKTIGDAYMVAGGIPERRPDHCEAVADMALEMQQVIHDRFTDVYPGIELRIGIHTGPVVAGVIGTKKYSYDLWGDSVNIASRMESHGVPGKIMVTSEVYEKLKEHYCLDYYGDIDIKGKGKMHTYLLMNKVAERQPGS